VGLIDDLAGGPIAVDTAPFIYFVEADSRYAPIVEPLFQLAAHGARQLVTSALTLMELLVVPYRAGNRPLAERYEALLVRSRGLELVDLSRDVLRGAAQLRAVTGAGTPDAIQLATALAAGCRTLVTNDRRLPAMPGLNVIQLSDYVR
jgi:predicted nucleic acid-binding protein